MKLTAEEREIAHLLPYVRTASHVGRYGWITATVSDEESIEAALEWLRESYWLKSPAELTGHWSKANRRACRGSTPRRPRSRSRAGDREGCGGDQRRD